MAGTTGLEPATSAVTGQRSNQLSYVPKLLIPLPCAINSLMNLILSEDIPAMSNVIHIEYLLIPYC